MDRVSESGLATIAQNIFHRVFRTSTDQPGFAVIPIQPDIKSRTLRRIMIRLKKQLSAELEKRHSLHLVCQSLGRFDQQSTTKFHRDGGPDQSILMLGYEPSKIISRLFAADFSLCAKERGVSTAKLLADLNPLLPGSEEILTKHAQELHEFTPAAANIVLFNNSGPTNHESRFLGVMHKGEVPVPDRRETRIINSIQLAIVSHGTAEPVSLADQRDFINTDEISIST